MTQPRPVRNTHRVGKRLTLTPEAQAELVAEAMAQATQEGEQFMTGVWGGVEARYTPSQREWYLKEMARSMRAARKAAAAAPVVEVPSAPEPAPLSAEAAWGAYQEACAVEERLWERRGAGYQAAVAARQAAFLALPYVPTPTALGEVHS